MVFVSLGLDCKKNDSNNNSFLCAPLMQLEIVDPLAYSTFFYPSENGPGERKEKMRPKNVIVF